MGCRVWGRGLGEIWVLPVTTTGVIEERGPHTVTRSRTLPWKSSAQVCVCAHVSECVHVRTQARAHGCKLTYLVVLLRVGWGLTGRIPLACLRPVFPCTLSSGDRGPGVEGAAVDNH